VSSGGMWTPAGCGLPCLEPASSGFLQAEGKREKIIVWARILWAGLSTHILLARTQSHDP
jgi:hypothetical protein